MKSVISKMDKKTYFKTQASFRAIANGDYTFYKDEIYWVRKADESDGVDPNKYVIIKGTFYVSSHYWEIYLSRFSEDPIMLNDYNGTNSLGIPVEKTTAKNVLKYID